MAVPEECKGGTLHLKNQMGTQFQLTGSQNYSNDLVFQLSTRGEKHLKRREGEMRACVRGPLPLPRGERVQGQETDIACKIKQEGGGP